MDTGARTGSSGRRRRCRSPDARARSGCGRPDSGRSDRACTSLDRSTAGEPHGRGASIGRPLGGAGGASFEARTKGGGRGRDQAERGQTKDGKAGRTPWLYRADRPASLPRRTRARSVGWKCCSDRQLGQASSGGSRFVVARGRELPKAKIKHGRNARARPLVSRAFCLCRAATRAGSGRDSTLRPSHQRSAPLRRKEAFLQAA
jgi:hypothetical protein